MYKFSVSIARFLVILIVIQSFSFAEGFTIPAKQSGPLSSLEAAGKSIDLLTSLKDENGQNLKPEDNGKWKDKHFLLPADARPDREARLSFLAKIHNSVKAKKQRRPVEGRIPSCPKPIQCPAQSSISEPTPPTKEHPFVQTSEDVTVEAGKAVVLAGFADENGKVYQLEADQSAAGVAKFSSWKSITILGLKPGTVTFTVWPTMDKNIRKLITVKVVESPASVTKVKTAPKGNSNWLWYLLWISVLGFLVSGAVLLVVRAMISSRQGTAQKPQSSGSGDDQLPPAQPVDDDDFEPEIL